MAAPFSLEDLAKLKSFVEFVAENPTILNLPQLDFLKKFIEDLGGVVPEGTFEMPAGAKCPFGGDVKSESKATPPPASAEDDEEEIPEMEAESEESEVELDLEANNMTVLEPNILYLDEKPPKVFKTKKTTALKKLKKKKITAKQLKSKRKLIEKENLLVKKERRSSGDMLEGDDDEPYDPLYTAKIEVKCELKEYNQEDGNNDFDEEEEKEKLNQKSELSEDKLQHSEDDYEEDDDDDEDYNDNEEDDDEPLIMLTRRKSKPRRKQIRELEKNPRAVECHDVCKQRCAKKFTEEQRKSICDYFWSLDKEERFAFIRKHTRVRRLTRMKRVNAVRSRAGSYCYYLKNYSIGKDESIPESSNDLERVCHKFFEATLCTTNHYIKKATCGASVQEIEKDLLLREEIKLAKERNKEKVNATAEPKQILDPETGNLIILDAKTKLAQKPSKKRVRRKPGDPEPEHFPKPIKCYQTCIHKCHEKFNEEERKKICDFFWSMDYKRRKDFILAYMDIKDIETETTPDFRKSNRPPRTYQSRYFMRLGGSRGDKVRVCKEFFTKTLNINRYFIKNAIEFADKTTGCYTGTDRRGAHEAANKISDDRKQIIMDHIESYPFWIPNKKSKTKYLHHSLTIKKMFDAYKQKCLAENIKNVNINYYYKIFHEDFQILFLTSTEQKKGWGLLRSNPNISHFTGKEAGGYWIDVKGNKLDMRFLDPCLTLDVSQQQNDSRNSSYVLNPFAASSVAEARALNVVHSPASVLPLKTLLNQQSLSLLRSDLNPVNFANLPTDSVNMLRML